MWTPWYIAAFATGIITIIVTIFSFLFPSRKITLLLRFTFDAVSIVNGICVYYATGVTAIWSVVAVDAVGIVRDVIYLFRVKYKWADKLFWLFLFEVIFAASLIITWDGPIALLPVIGSLICNVALYLKDVKMTKIVSIVGQIPFILYYALLINDSDLLTALSLVASTTFFISAVIGLSLIILRQNRVEMKKDKNHVKY